MLGKTRNLEKANLSPSFYPAGSPRSLIPPPPALSNSKPSSLGDPLESCLVLFCFVVLFSDRYHYVVVAGREHYLGQADLELTETFLRLPPKSWELKA